MAGDTRTLFTPPQQGPPIPEGYDVPLGELIAPQAPTDDRFYPEHEEDRTPYPSPYPEGYDPALQVDEPTAQGIYGAATTPATRYQVPGSAAYDAAEVMADITIAGGVNNLVQNTMQTIAPAPDANDPLGIALSVAPAGAGLPTVLSRPVSPLVRMGLEATGEVLDPLGAAVREGVRTATPAVQRLATEEVGSVRLPGGKEPWEMQRDEYAAYLRANTDPQTLGEHPKMLDPGVPERLHENMVNNQLRQGKPVPPEVLADYPELAAKAPTPPLEPPVGGAVDTPPAATAPPAPPIEPPVPPSGGTPGAPPPAGSPLDRTIKMLESAERPPSIGERIQAIRTSLPERYRGFQEMMTDRFAGINALGDDVEQTVARLGGLGDMQAQRAVDIATTVKGALGAPWDGAGKHLDAYLHLKQAIDIEAAKGPQRLIPGGIKGAKEASQGLTELQAMLGPQRWEQLERAAATAVSESQATLNRLVAGGLVARELADELLAKYPHYNRQNIILQTEEVMRGVGKNRISVTSANLKRLTETGTEQGRVSPYASIIGSASDAEALVARNQAARKVAEAAIARGDATRVSGTRIVAQVAGAPQYRRPAGEIPGTISYMENGERVLVEVPKWLEREAKAITNAADDVLIRSVSVLNALPRSAFITYNPAWPAANLAVDYFTALMTHGVSPLEEARGIIGAFKDVLGNDPVLAQMRRSGGGQSGWFARGPDEIASVVKKSGNLAITEEKTWWDFAKAVSSAPFRATKTYGSILEQGTRRAVFTTSLKRQGVKDIAAAPKNALEQAAFDARRSTIDFQRAGELARAINSVSIFFNAGVQGALLPARALRDTPRARWALGTAMGANLGLYTWNRQFPEYEDVPRDVKRGSIIVMLPSTEFDTQGRRKPNYVTVIPKVREWGLFFGTMNYVLETLDGKAHESFGSFLGLIAQQSTPVDAGLLTPTVPGQVILEEMINKDFYRDRPIVPPEQAGLAPTEQYDAYTSETLKQVAQQMGISPLRLQHVVYGMAGGAARTATSIADPLLRQLNPTDMDFRIAELAQELDDIRPPMVKPEEVGLRRTEFISSLSPTDREAVLNLSRQSEQRVPVLGAMASRFYAPRGGELYRLGQEAAEDATGESAERTADMSRALGKVSDVIDEKQLAQDATFLEKGDGTAWREAHKENGTLWRGALLGLGVVFPDAAQLESSDVWQEYQTNIYTLAGAIDDRRTRGQLLAAGYRAIPLEEIDPLTKDFDVFFQRRAEYRASLSDEDRALLDRTLQATMTEVEKQYSRDQETLRPYWEVKAEHAAAHPDAPQAFLDKLTSAKRDYLFKSNQEMRQALFRWGYRVDPYEAAKKRYEAKAGVR